MTTLGKSLELFFVDGLPDGMLTAEVFNWTGHVLVAPRTQLKQALARREAGHTGVYLLLGETDGKPSAYIGEAEDVGSRIKNHDSKKDWWNKVVFVTTSADSLHKAHVKYLEAPLIEEAIKVGSIPLGNLNKPALPSLSEAARANMEVFLETLNLVLPAIRVDMFLNKKRPSATVQEGPDQREIKFILESKKHDLSARAVLRDGEFIVQKGSGARAIWTQPGKGYGDLHSELLARGVMQVEGPNCFFTENYAFSSTSAAAAVVLGRAVRGPTEWKLAADGKTYKEWEAGQLQGNEAAE